MTAPDCRGPGPQPDARQRGKFAARAERAFPERWRVCCQLWGRDLCEMATCFALEGNTLAGTTCTERGGCRLGLPPCVWTATAPMPLPEGGSWECLFPAAPQERGVDRRVRGQQQQQRALGLAPAQQQAVSERHSTRGERAGKRRVTGGGVPDSPGRDDSMEGGPELEPKEPGPTAREIRWGAASETPWGDGEEEEDVGGTGPPLTAATAAAIDAEADAILRELEGENDDDLL